MNFGRQHEGPTLWMVLTLETQHLGTSAGEGLAGLAIGWGTRVCEKELWCHEQKGKGCGGNGHASIFAIAMTFGVSRDMEATHRAGFLGRATSCRFLVSGGRFFFFTPSSASLPPVILYGKYFRQFVLFCVLY